MKEGGLERSATGDIHHDRCKDFWKSLNPGDWVLSVLEKSYKMPLIERPAKYKESNNSSAKAEWDFVKEEVKKLVKKDIIKASVNEPHCVNPLSVVSRLKENGEKKHRLCIDLS